MKKEIKIKIILRRIIFIPPLLIISPLLWLFSGNDWKGVWEFILESTSEETFEGTWENGVY